MGVMDAFSLRLKELREASGMNQDQLAKELGVSRGSISFYENGDRVPDIEFLFQMSKFFSVSTDWLLGLSPVKEIDGELRQVCQYTGLSDKSVSLLHSSKFKGSEFNLWAGLVDNVLTPECIFAFSRDTWRSAMMAIQARRNEINRKDEDIEERRIYNDALKRSVLDEKADSMIAQIPVYDAARFYKNAAVAKVSDAAKATIERYILLAKNTEIEMPDRVDPEQKDS